jgi:hypothetical protein
MDIKFLVQAIEQQTDISGNKQVTLLDLLLLLQEAQELEYLQKNEFQSRMEDWESSEF